MAIFKPALLPFFLFSILFSGSACQSVQQVPSSLLPQYLQNAINETLAQKSVTVQRSETYGCMITKSIL